MKKYVLATALVASACGISSCDKFLDITPVGKVIPTTTQDYRELMNKAYDIKFNDKGYTELRTDIAEIRDDASDQTLFADLQTWNDASNKNASVELGWSEYYSALYYANAIIHNSGSISGGTANERNQLIGEAYMMRAFINFTLVNLYGQPYTKTGAPESLSVPLKLDTDLEDALGRSTVSAVYSSVLSDISTARGLINVDTMQVAQRYRFNKASVDALQARVYLYQANWTEALAASERVLQAKDSLEDLTLENGQYILPNRYNSKEIICAYEQIVNSGLQRAIRATPEFYNSFSSGDRRKSLFFGSQVENKTYYNINKIDNTIGSKVTFRTAEFYLTSAEAAARLGNLQTARQRLLQLLQKRYEASAYTTLATSINAMSQTELIDEILTERKKELCYEGHLWFDLRRTTRPAMTKTINNVTYNLSQDDARYTLRIPRVAIENNPNLVTQ